VGAVKDIDIRIAAIETGTPVDPPIPVFIMTLGSETLIANIANVDGTYDSYQRVKGDDTAPVAGDGSWTVGSAVPYAFPIDTSWTASTLQPMTFYLWLLNGTAVTGFPSQTVTATTTRTVPQTPNDVTFNAIGNVEADSTIVSNTVAISGLLAPTAITVAGGTYSKNGADTFTSAAGAIENGDTIRLGQTSSASDLTPTTCTVQLGLQEETWTVTTADTGNVAGVISIVAATYAADEDAGPIAVTLRNTGKSGAIAVGCRVSTLYDPDYHTAVEGFNYTAIVNEDVEWASGSTADQTVNIYLIDQGESFDNVGELIIVYGSEYGGATVDTDLDATLFSIGGTAGAATPSWEQLATGDHIVKVQLESSNNTLELDSGHTWVTSTLDSRDCIYSGTGFSYAPIPGYSSSNPRAVCPVNFTQTGTHYVHISGIGTGYAAAVIAHIDTTESTSKFIWALGSTWDWYTSSGYSIEVPSTGVHDLKLFLTDELVYVDAVILTTNASYDSATNGDGESDSVWGTGATGANPDNPLVPQGPEPVVEDKTPDPFGFGELIDQAVSATNLESTPVIITGINVPCPISITSDPSGTAEYEIDESGSWVTAAGTISVGQTVTCRLDSSGSNDTTVTMDLKIGTVTQSFSVTTIPSGAVGGLTPTTSTVVVSTNNQTIQDLDIKIASGGGPGISINPGVDGTIITNCRISSVDSHGIIGKGIGSLDINYCEISNCWGSGVYADTYTSFTGTYCTIENVHTGFDLWAGRSGNTLVQNNWIKNMWKRLGTGIASENANAIALRFCYGPNNLIDNNIIINEPGNCHVEDKISCYACTGTSSSWFTITNNKLKGKSDSVSDAVILVGDSSGTYMLVEDNVSLDAGQSGVAFSQGHDMTLRRNKVLCRPLYKYTDQTVGISNVNVSPGFAAYTLGNPAPYNIVYEDNDITFWKAANYNNTGNTSEVLSPYWFVNTSFIGPNDIGGWLTNRFDVSWEQPASLTEADVWDTDWENRPPRIT
jgi:hypothetical protein